MIQTAVIGAGRVAQQHLACLSTLNDVRVVGVADLSRSLAESAADRFGAKGWYTDHERMLAEARPDIVHITTPPASHFRLAADCLNAGAHVFLEKPATVHFEDFLKLRAIAEANGKLLIEDYNYLYNTPVRRLLDMAGMGELGEVVHVEVMLCLNILDKDHPAMDQNLHNPVLDLPGGVITDFLPHLASLAYSFCGSADHVKTLWQKRRESSPLPFDEMRALLRGARATGTVAFSAHSQPDTFRVTVSGTRGRATADIFEDRLTHAWLRTGPKPLMPLWNALDDAKVTRRSAWRLLWRKLSGGPGAYEGLWLLIGNIYASLAANQPPPIVMADMLEINRLVAELQNEGNRI